MLQKAGLPMMKLLKLWKLRGNQLQLASRLGQRENRRSTIPNEWNQSCISFTICLDFNSYNFEPKLNHDMVTVFAHRWATHWFKVDFEVPQSWSGEEVRFAWNSNSEAMIWIDGKPRQVHVHGNTRSIRSNSNSSTHLNTLIYWLLYLMIFELIGSDQWQPEKRLYLVW